MSDHEANHNDHHPEAIRRRLGRSQQHSYAGDAVLGAIAASLAYFIGWLLKFSLGNG